MDKNTMIANTVTMGGITLCLAIAQLPLIASAAIITGTAVGCAYLTGKQSK